MVVRKSLEITTDKRYHCNEKNTNATKFHNNLQKIFRSDFAVEIDACRYILPIAAILSSCSEIYLFSGRIVRINPEVSYRKRA